MRHSALAACALLCLVPSLGFAQAAAESGQFGYCQVEDTGGRKIWVSQVFPAPTRTEFLSTALATEFHAYVGTLGGAGNKICVIAMSRAAAEETRAKIAAIMGKRVFGIRVYKWHDVNWTPSAATYAGTAPAPNAAAGKFIYCRTVDTDKRVLVSTEVFVQTLPPMNDIGHFQELTRYAGEFGARAAAAQGIAAGDALCIASDTRPEADKSRNDFRKAFPFSGIRKVDMVWMPGPGPADEVEEDFWHRIASSENAEDFEDDLAAYPQGRHAPVARLEAKRLRRGAAGAAAPASSGDAVAHQVAAERPAASAPAPEPEYPINEDIGKQIASGAFFQVPAGNGQPVQRSGSRIVNKTVPVLMDSTLQRVAGGNLCRMDQTSTAGAGASAFKTTAAGQSWAGFIPLSMRTHLSSQFGVIDSVFKLVAIEKLVGQPFPLVAGNAFGFDATFENLDGSSKTSRYGQNFSCRVGATTPASGSIPGMAGEQTEVTCRASFVGLSLPPQEPIMIWYSAAGCFLQDPTR